MRWALVFTIAVLGMGSVCFGVWLIYPPAMFILGGAFLMAGALFYDVKPRSERDKTGRRPPR